jgi:dimeric dUTPase (all-alpha-NTP-PPase superfamily)
MLGSHNKENIMAKSEKTKSDKTLENLKKLYSEQTALNRKVLAAEKLYATELKAEAKAAVKLAKTVQPAKKTAAQKTGTQKAPARRRVVAGPAKA